MKRVVYYPAIHCEPRVGGQKCNCLTATYCYPLVTGFGDRPGILELYEDHTDNPGIQAAAGADPAVSLPYDRTGPQDQLVRSAARDGVVGEKGEQL